MAEDPPKKTTITRSGWSGSFKNPFPEFRFLSAWEACQFLLWEKDNTDLPECDAVLDEMLPMCLSDFHDSNDNCVTWIGHATCLVKIAGLSILTDPIFSQNCSPIQLNLAKRLHRYRQPGITLNRISSVDAVVVSHNHHDHLDYYSVLDINKRFKDCQWFVPAGLKSWFVASAIPADHVHELKWWEYKDYTFGNGSTVKFTCLPAQHWSMRYLLDRNQSLWCGWGIRSEEKNVYFAGDTGYNDRIFNEIGYHSGPFDLSLIPIGAYMPREFLKFQHVDPKQAVEIHKDVKSKLSLGIHWGTFMLGYENYLAPKRDLESALGEAGVDKEAFITLKHGESKNI